VLFIPAFTILFNQKFKNVVVSSVFCKLAMSLAALVTLVSSQDVLFNVPSELHGASQL
jgi:uncharacterized membrane protein YfcA